jgi:hypothetical protein
VGTSNGKQICLFFKVFYTIPPARLERATCRLEVGGSLKKPPCFPSENSNSASDMLKNMLIPPDLARLIAVWPSLPEHARATILSIVEASQTAKRKAA